VHRDTNDTKSMSSDIGTIRKGRLLADAVFWIELPALQQWRFTQADARRIRQPVLSVLGADSHTLWPGWIEVHQLLQAWLPQAEAFVLGWVLPANPRRWYKAS
jgi:hypothetical protein